MRIKGKYITTHCNSVTSISGSHNNFTTRIVYGENITFPKWPNIQFSNKQVTLTLLTRPKTLKYIQNQQCTYVFVVWTAWLFYFRGFLHTCHEVWLGSSSRCCHIQVVGPSLRSTLSIEGFDTAVDPWNCCGTHLFFEWQFVWRILVLNILVLQMACSPPHMYILYIIQQFLFSNGHIFI